MNKLTITTGSLALLLSALLLVPFFASAASMRVGNGGNSVVFNPPGISHSSIPVDVLSRLQQAHAEGPGNSQNANGGNASTTPNGNGNGNNAQDDQNDSGDDDQDADANANQNGNGGNGSNGGASGGNGANGGDAGPAGLIRAGSVVTNATALNAINTNIIRFNTR